MRKYLKRSLCVLLTFLMIVGLLPSDVLSNTAAAAAKPKMKQAKVTVLVGKKKTLAIKSKKKSDKITWKTSKKKVVTVSKKGKIKGIKKGSAKVTATVVRGSKKYNLKTKVTVVKGAKSIYFADAGGKKITTISVMEEDAINATLKQKPASANETYTVKSSDTDVVYVNGDNSLSAVKAGTATVTAKSLSGKKATLTVTVETLLPQQPLGPTDTLKDIFAPYCSIGTCVSSNLFRDATTLAEMKKQYSSVTMENAMKPDGLLGSKANLIGVDQAEYPVPETYKDTWAPKLNWSDVDYMLQTAKDNGLKVRAHTLVWHSQTPNWFFREEFSAGGKLVSKEVMDGRMEYYIKQVMTHVKEKFPGVVYAWDVVNEAFSNDGGGLRGSVSGKWETSNWYSIYKSDEFIVKAFTLARKYQETDAKLFYNDYNEYIPAKTEDICNLAKKLIENGKLIDGIGMQSHYDVDYPTVENVRTAIKAFAALGLEVQLTEIDCTIDSPQDYKKQGEFYGAWAKMLLEEIKAGAKITNLTFWGMIDDTSWRSSQYPLLFATSEFLPKPAFYAILAAVKAGV